MLGIGLSLTGRLRSSVSIFSPVSLFSSNEPGIWLDPSDVANLAWRRNLLTFTEQFDNAAWTKTNTSATANTITVASNANNIVYAPASGVAVSAGTVTSSCEFKAGTASFVTLAVWKGNNPPGYTGAVVWVDLQNGQIGSSRASAGYAVVSTGVTPVGDGWFRAWITATVPSDTIFHEIRAVDSDNTFNVTAVSGKTILARKAQLEAGTLTDYQRISDVNTEVIERFPSATLYQDTAGTTPVTTPGQTVALALDKSKGLVLGSELVTNGTFDTDTSGWTLGSAAEASISYASGEALVTNTASAFGRGYVQTLTLTVGRTYRVSGGLRRTAGSGSATVAAQNNSESSILAQSVTVTASTTTSVDFVFTATETNNKVYMRVIGASTTFAFDNISVKELPGFHATQATLASRPTYGIVPLGGRRNLLTRTEEFENAAWTKTSTVIVADAAVAPNGSSTADKVYPSVTSAAAAINRNTTGFAAASIISASCYFKAAEKGFGYIQANGQTGGTVVSSFVTVDLATGSVGTIGVLAGGGLVSATASSVSVGNGWWRLTLSGGIGASNTAAEMYVGVCDAQNSRSVTASGTNGILIWGAQLETGSSATAYQRVGSVFDVTEAGVASLSYLSFDGVDDFLVTPTITPGIDRAQVFAGVRKLGDTNACIAEVSTNGTSVNGAFVVQADDVGRYSARSRGTVAASAIATVNTFTPPVTNVLTGLGDISADLATLRVNGTQVAQSTADQGTGNFLAYPLYIGRRGGTTLPFNGQIYSLLVRFGTNLDAGTITSTETWVNQRTGAYT